MIIIKQMYKVIFFIFLILSLSKNSLSKPINFHGLSKLNMDDIQSITSINIYDNDLLIEDVNNIIKELVLSDLIYDVSYEDTSDLFYVKIQEADLIQNIFINNNIWIKDDLIIQNLTSKKNYFLIKDYVENDIKAIKNIYKSKGFQNILVTAKVEKFSKDRTNLIYEIKEGKQQKINIIKFVGNNFFSNSYLNTIIKSQSIKFYNIFKSGSNLNYSIFEFDKNQILLNYRNEGFTNVKVNYVLEKSNLNNNILYFYIEEGQRAKINNLQYNFENQSLFNFISDLSSKLDEDLKKNDYFFDKNLIDDYLETFNLSLSSNNIFNKIIEVNIDYNNENIDITFLDKNNLPVVINKINIEGNSITKNKTIRSKISIEPGEYLNQYKLTNSLKNLKRYPYIKDVSFETSIKNQLADININLEEDTKTGNVLVAGTFNADTGAGLTFGIEDKNIFGSGNSVSSNFTANSEDLKFDINYIQYPLLNPNLTNTYSLFNQEYDYTSSFGYKASKRGIGYFVNFKQSDTVSYGSGIEYESFKGHSAINNTSTAISDNIGNFQNYRFKFSIKHNTTNDFYNPSEGTINSLNFIVSPNDISDNSYYKVKVTNKNYRTLNRSKNFIFLNNNYGYAKSINSKLKTIDAFGLGGLNFKGFDYKGIGPYDGKVYLGGNEYFTSTIGYGSSFIFDDKDNVNVKFFLTTGSIWNSDYVSSSDIDIRSSIGASLDFITPIGPISFSYASPIEKNNSDKTRPFNFTIGTSF